MAYLCVEAVHLHDADGAHQYLQVEPQAPVLHVGRVQRDVAVERGVLALFNLPQSDHSRQNVQPAQIRQIVLLHPESL
jgi:hypothetical protein